MLELFTTELEAIDKVIAAKRPSEYPALFKNIPLEIFGAVQIDRPDNLPNINNALPAMPADRIQNDWTGNSGHRLLQQSVAFIRTVIGHYHEVSGTPLAIAKVQDYGCGWGRLIRLLYKYVPYDQIWGLDPWEESIRICRDGNIRANLRVSDYLPRDLPVEGNRFDLIYAFSVFSHLSAKATRMAAEVLARHLTDDGLLAITIRPVEYWKHHRRPHKLKASEVARLEQAHREQGFVFEPHNRAPIEGDITYGDSSMSLDYIEQNFPDLEIESLDWNETDPLQVIVFLRKRR